jgi:hypothetical protein
MTVPSIEDADSNISLPVTNVKHRLPQRAHGAALLDGPDLRYERHVVHARGGGLEKWFPPSSPDPRIALFHFVADVTGDQLRFSPWTCAAHERVQRPTAFAPSLLLLRGRSSSRAWPL